MQGGCFDSEVCRFIYFDRAFHGRTVFALNVTQLEYDPIVTSDFLGFDEVQTAGGQTGTMFAVDQFDLPYPPQAVATAKKFGNGVVYILCPMQDRGVLDSTWGGSLCDMVRFVQEMRIVREERLLEKVEEKTACLVAGLDELALRYNDLIFNVRGMGLYQGFSLRNASHKNMLCRTALEVIPRGCWAPGCRRSGCVRRSTSRSGRSNFSSRFSTDAWPVCAPDNRPGFCEALGEPRFVSQYSVNYINSSPPAQGTVGKQRLPAVGGGFTDTYG